MVHSIVEPIAVLENNFQCEMTSVESKTVKNMDANLYCP